MFVIVKTVDRVRRYFVKVQRYERQQVILSANILNARLFISRQEAQAMINTNPLLNGCIIIPRNSRTMAYPLTRERIVHKLTAEAS